MEIAPQIDLLRKHHATMTKNEAQIANNLPIQNPSSTFIHKNKSLVSTSSLLSRSAMAYNTSAPLEKLNYTDRVEFGICQDRFGQFVSTKMIRITWMKLKVSEKDDNKTSDWYKILQWERQV